MGEVAVRERATTTIAMLRVAARRCHGLLVQQRCASTHTSPLLRSMESAGEVVGKKLKIARDATKDMDAKYQVVQKATDLKRLAYIQAGVEEKTGDKVIKGAAMVGAGIQAVLMFKKTVAMGCVAMAATAVGKVKAPEVTNTVISTEMKTAGAVAQGGSALVRGIRTGMGDNEVEKKQIEDIADEIK